LTPPAGLYKTLLSLGGRPPTNRPVDLDCGQQRTNASNINEYRSN